MKRISIATLPGADLISHRHKAGTGLLKVLLRHNGKTQKVITLSAPNQSQITQICRLLNEGEEDEATRFLVTSCFMPTWSSPHYPPTRTDVERVVATSACSAYLDAVIRLLQEDEDDFPALLEVDG